MPELAPTGLELERHRSELTGYCGRILGSPFEAEDAVQEAMVRAWRGLHRLERRATMRAWLYRIATNVCRDMLQGRARRPAITVDPAPEGPPEPHDDPAELAASRESVRLALGTALRHLPPRQRAALILCEVLRWRASEAAELLGTSVASVTSALQRARATLATRDAGAAEPPPMLAAPERKLLAGYVDAFERHDMTRLTSLIHADVTRSTGAACG